MTVTYLDPAAEEGTPAEPYELFLDASKPGLTIGLLANSFPDATNFMDCVELELRKLSPSATFLRYQKPSVEPATPAQLSEITAACDGMIAAWGH